MRINFEVAGQPAEFFWSSWSGRAQLVLQAETVDLQSPLAVSSHHSLGLVRVWRHVVDGHTVEIEKLRPRLLAGFRPNAFTVRVGEEVIARRTGR